MSKHQSGNKRPALHSLCAKPSQFPVCAVPVLSILDWLSEQPRLPVQVGRFSAKTGVAELNFLFSVHKGHR